MSRYIDADALIDKLNNAIECGHRVDMPISELEAVLNDVTSAPSIDIVRCRECKYYHNHYVDMTPPYAHNYCYKWSRYVVADDFCSYGERKGSE